MTKDEIKKGLECCITLKADSCKECPYGNTDCSSDKLQRDALNLITEQEEHIKIQNQQLSNWEKNYTQSFERLKAQQREIEQLKAENDTNMKYIRMMGIQSHIKTSNEQVKQAKIEVLKEVKEMLDSEPDKWSYTIYIDDLIKELQNET